MHINQQNFLYSYVPWNLHEEIKGQFNFEGILDIVWVYAIVKFLSYKRPVTAVQVEGLGDGRCLTLGHSRPQRPRSFWSAPRIATSGPVQRHSVFEWLWKHNRLRSEPIRFVRLDFWTCAEWREVRESQTSGVGHGQRSRFLVLTKRSVASGYENDFGV